MSSTTDEVLALERRFWDEANSPAFFERTIADGGLTVIEPMGVIPKGMAVQAAGQGDRWVDVEFSDVAASEVMPGCVVLAYHARAKRESDGTPYQGSIASTWVRGDGGWQLALTCHQPWKG
jgi:Domain of unknown function (DUF4440)